LGEQVATHDEWTRELYAYALSIPSGERSILAAKAALQYVTFFLPQH
jgi:hypothetical protein